MLVAPDLFISLLDDPLHLFDSLMSLLELVQQLDVVLFFSLAFHPVSILLLQFINKLLLVLEVSLKNLVFMFELFKLLDLVLLHFMQLLRQLIVESLSLKQPRVMIMINRGCFYILHLRLQLSKLILKLRIHLLERLALLNVVLVLTLVLN